MNKVMEGWNGKQVTGALLWAKSYASVPAVMTSTGKAPARQHGNTGPHPGREKPGEDQTEDSIKRGREIEGDTLYFAQSGLSRGTGRICRSAEVAARTTGGVGGQT